MSATVLPSPTPLQHEAVDDEDMEDVQCDSLRYDIPPMPDLHQALIYIDEEIGEEEIEGLKFLCRDNMPVSKLDKAESALEIFDMMQKLVLIADNNFDYLLECLGRIHRVDLVRKLGVQPEAVRNHLPHFKKLLPFRTLLMDITEDLDNQEMEKIRFFLRGKIRKKPLNEKRSLLQLFVFMEQEGLLAHNNLDLLIVVMESIRRGDLVDMILEYQGLPPRQRHEPGLHRNTNAVVPSQHAPRTGSGQSTERIPSQGSGEQRQELVQSGSAGNFVGQQRQELVQSGSAGNFAGQDRNSQIERSVSAGTLSVNSEENMEIPNRKLIPEPLFLQIADDLKHIVNDLGIELGISNEDLVWYTQQIPDVKQRTVRILQDWQASTVDKGTIAPALHYVLGKLDLKKTASDLKQWMDSLSTGQVQTRRSLSDFEPAGPPEDSENVCVSFRNAQMKSPLDQMTQQNTDNVQVVTDLQQLNINPDQLARQRGFKYVNGGAVYKQGDQYVLNTGISQPLQQVKLPATGQGQMVPGVPAGQDQMMPGVPTIQGQMLPGVPPGQGQMLQGVPAGQVEMLPVVPAGQGQMMPVVPAGQGQMMQGFRAGQGQILQGVPADHRRLTETLGGLQLPTYRMNRRPRGWCVILNNEKFYVDQADRSGQVKEMPPRNGTERDAATLQELFQKLGFIVQRRDNLTDSQMMNVLIDAAHNVDHTNFDCFVCCILTHGVLGHLYGSNGRLVSIKDLTSTFQTNRCNSLAGKPKLFFLQACQGRDKMEGGEIPQEYQQDGPVPVSLEGSNLYADNGVREMIPNEADFLLGYATVPGYVSFRSRNHGSWYIRKLCELLEKHAANYDLMTILVQVNHEVAAANASMDNSVYKQIPAPLVTLRKRIFFR